MDSSTPVSSSADEDSPSSPPAGSQTALAYERIMQQIADHSNELRELRLSVQALCEVKAPGHPRTRLHQESKMRHLAQQAWSEIGAYDLLADSQGNLPEYSRKDAPTLPELLSPVRQYPWTTWAYRKSYPALARYLDRQQTIVTNRLQVTCTERTQNGQLIVRESKPPLHDHASLWNHISTRFTGIPDNYNHWDTIADDTRAWTLALTRTLNVRDIDPTMAMMLLGSTPRIHVSMVAAFLDRYLGFRNWASASSWPLRSPQRNAFIFEYHIAFYSVTPTELHPDLAVKDHRGLRRSAVFGPEDDETDRWIHEEQLSFFLVGLGKSVFTCYQLSERYHNTPKASFAFQAARYDGPSAVFMNWLTSSFHHVAWRWHRIIDALNDKIHTAADIVFQAEDPDLLADDPKFTKSRTYFWALQTYKMFDERLTEILTTWEKFRQNRFYEINDGVLPQEYLNLGLERIEASVEKLRSLQEVVRKKSAEVESLRHGLFGASALFDSRTAVRQGDNIRLLTYITLLFLPLTFTTSIYGMQVVLPQLAVTYFWVTLPIVIVVTALVVFNLQDIVDLYDLLSSKVTKRLRTIMQHHHREEWREMGMLLKHDRALRQAPIRKIRRSTSHWDYVIFLIESLIFDLPVHEITWIGRSYRAWRERVWVREEEQPKGVQTPEEKRKDLKSRTARVMAAKHTEDLGLKSEEESRFKRGVNRVLGYLLILLRLFCMPLWILVVAIEYLVILPISIANPDDEFQEIGAPGSKAPKCLLVLVQPLVWVGFGRQKGSRASQARQEKEAANRPGAFPETHITKTDAELKTEAIAKVVTNVAEARMRSRAARMARRSLHGSLHNQTRSPQPLTLQTNLGTRAASGARSATTPTQR